jgi:hypothetical protein
MKRKHNQYSQRGESLRNIWEGKEMTAQPQPARKMSNKMIIMIAALLVCLLLVSACTSTPASPTATTINKDDAIKTAIASIIMTTTASAPTNTPLPTSTPKPTLTPTPLPKPILLSGTGDSVLDVDMAKVGEEGIAHITGNKSARFFAVTSYDANGKQIDLLVNTTDVYDGYVPIDFTGSQITTRLEVSATDAWTIEILPLLMGHVIESPGTYQGKGDDVLLVPGFKTHPPDTAKIVGNKSSSFFAVVTYGVTSSDLKVNTTDPYDGTVILASDTCIFVISATSDWSIEIKSK